ncbi:uncharacterized protein CCR75_009352 [Bremia lactucae]|uniref:CRAL-TRIO domain-containing protein n=1 Tax=Bremia lactucae TaxID=4779 RepID=A0A976IKZ1_BRELC|nr:hypothetical protein CCR75_009352 [Bremia lactucae]
MRDMGVEAFKFDRRCTGMMQRHYPQRLFRIFINVPSWFGMAWKGVKPLLNEATRGKTNISTEGETAAALFYFVTLKICRKNMVELVLVWTDVKYTRRINVFNER